MNQTTNYQYPHHHHHHHHHHHRSSLWGKWGKRFFYLIGFLLTITMLVAILKPDFFNALVPLGVNVAGSGQHDSMDYDGLDVSHHQGKINWMVLAEDTAVQFVYIKATEGSTFVDEYYRRNIDGAKRAGIPAGSYHYLTSSSSVTAQADLFIRTAKRSEQRLRPMVDIEAEGVRGWSHEQIGDSLERFVNLLRRHYHVWPVIYSYSKFYNTHLAPRFNDFHLFLAHYNDKEPVVAGAGKHSLWQHTDQGTVDGIPKPVDLDVFSKGTSLVDILIPVNLD